MANFGPLAEILPIYRLDPSGELQHGIAYAFQYLPFVRRQRALLTQMLGERKLGEALVELHFMLISIDRVKDGMNSAKNKLPNDLGTHFSNIDLSGHKRARDHFEHIEDRLYGTKKNSIKPVTEDATTKMIHFGFTDGKSTEFSWKGDFFRWSDQQVDVSDAFVLQLENWTNEAWRIVEAKF